MDDFSLRLLSEAARTHGPSTAGHADARTHAQADAAARQAGGDLEHRILARTRARHDFADYSEALERVRLLFAVGLGLLAGLAALAGAATVQAALAPDEHGQLNFFTLLFALLGLQFLALLAWLALFVFSGGANGLLGSIAREVLQKFVLWAGRSGIQVAVLSATISVLFRSALGRWTVGVITHGLWLAFLVAALGLTVFQLSTKSYAFVWETTILSSSFFVPLTEFLSILPGLLGFPVPNVAAVMASEATGANPGAVAHRDAWAGLLFGAIAVYGLIPRFVLLVFCLVMGRRARRGHRLDTAAPGFAELAPRLMPHASKGGYADAGAGAMPAHGAGRAAVYVNRITANPDGPVAVLGLEIERPATGWPPDIGEPGLIDLGCIDSGHDLRSVLDTLKSPQAVPRQIIFVGSLLTTPDRGLRAQFEQVLGGIDVPATLVLTDGGAFRERSHASDVALRVSDWRSMAAEFFPEPENIVEIDLDHLTEVTRARLASLASGEGNEQVQASGNRLRACFDLILEEYAVWQDGQVEPGHVQQAELHRRIAQLYSGEDDEDGKEGGFLSFGEKLDIDVSSLGTRLQAGADMMTGILPGRLVADPRWLLAGALAGSLGCIAAATLASPMAIAALPLWAGAGAALSAVLPSREGKAPETTTAPAWGTDAVRSAVLFSLVLDAQGYDEVTITRLIDDAIGDDEDSGGDDGGFATLAGTQGWLDRVHTRYQAAQKREAGR